MAPSKVLVIGDINGTFESVFSKVAALHSKTNFSFAIIAGALFAPPDSTTEADVDAVARLLDGQVKVPLTTYFALGRHALPDKVAFRLDASQGGEICENLFFLGRRTTTKTAEGVRIVALGGSFAEGRKSAGEEGRHHVATYSAEDAKSLKGANHADILITSEWPDGIRKGSKVEFATGQKISYRTEVAELDAALKPKYHFTTSPTAFFEREPFFHPSEENADTFSITRFISLAAFGNANKQKWVYAFTIDPTASAPMSIPPGTTTTPLSAESSRKRAALPSHQQQDSLRFSNDAYHEDNRGRKRRKRDRGGPPPGPAECFFCLSNVDVATHLIASIGEDSYLTTAKGPLTTASTFPELDFPAHMLIIPLSHAPAMALVEDEASRKAAWREMTLYKTALDRMLKGKDEKGALSSVCWSVSRGRGVHVHWQWLPVRTSLVSRGLVAAAFKVEAENTRYPHFERKSVDENEGEDYFRVVVWNGETGQEESLVMPLDESVRFDAQFGRRVVAKLLGLDGRANWKDCGQDVEEEEKDVKMFKDAFKEFDFSLES